MSTLTLEEQAAPSTPGANKITFYPKADGRLYWKDDTGVEYAVSTGDTAWTTGDVKLTLKAVADSGWVLANDGTIGNAASGGTTRANADTSALFTLLWTNVADAQAAVSGGRGASAAADYAANKTIALTKMLGRALGIAGAGSGLTSRALGLITGVETHSLSIAELAAHTHGYIARNAGSNTAFYYSGTGTTQTDQTTSTGSGTAHQNMQPTAFLNVMIKL